MVENILSFDYLKWLIAAGIVLVSYVVLRSVQQWGVNKGRAKSQSTTALWDDVLVDLLSNIKRYFIFTCALYIGFVWIKLDARPRLIIDKTLILVLLLQVGQLVGRVIQFWITKHLKAKEQEDLELASTISLVSFALKTIAYSVLVLLALNNLGVDVTALIAGLGVGGIAVALALQNILTDLFSSLTIVLDKPFIVGDFIIINDLMGTVEHIGLKTTRARSLSGEQLIFGNGDLLQSRIRNYKRMSERRIVQALTVTYQTDADALDAIPLWIEEIVKKQDKVRFDRCHFLHFKDSALEFELVYWILSPDFNDYADRAQRINIAIFRKFTQEGIEFAYPTQTLFLQRPKAALT